MTRTTISNNDDIIDSRDVIARIAELEGERDNLVCDVEFHKEKLTDVRANQRTEEMEQAYADAQSALEEWDDDNRDELKALQSVEEQSNSQPPIRVAGPFYNMDDALAAAMEIAKNVAGATVDVPREITSLAGQA